MYLVKLGVGIYFKLSYYRFGSVLLGIFYQCCIVQINMYISALKLLLVLLLQNLAVLLILFLHPVHIAGKQ